MQQNNRLLRKEYLKVLFPIMFSVLGGTINALIDSVFVSWRIGENGLSAVNVSMPVYLILCTMGALVSYGAAFLSAKAAGNNDMKKASALYHSSLLLGILMGALVMALGLIFLEPVTALLSQKTDLASYVKDYCRVTLLGAIPFILSYIPLNYLQLEGKEKNISISIAVMVISDMVLDYVFLYPANMGMTGAALASLLSITLASLYGFLVLQRKDSDYRLFSAPLRLSSVRRILQYGSAQALGNLYDALKLFSINSIILKAMGQGGESAAIWAVLNTLSELSLIISTGVPRTGALMLSLYHASRENRRMRILLKLETRTGLILSTVFALGLCALSRPLASVYSLREPMLFPLSCLGLGAIFVTLGSILDVYLNASGHIVLSNLQVALRRLVFPVLSAIALSRSGRFFWAFLVLGNLLPLIFYTILARVLSKRSRRTKRPLSPFFLMDDHLDREHKVLDFSVPANMEAVCGASEQIRDFCALHQMERKLTMRLGLAIEELLNVMLEKDPTIKDVDLRAFALEGAAGIRIRCAGSRYNPFEDEDSDDDFLLGIHMLKKMAHAVNHTYTLGMNTINIIFPFKEEQIQS